MKFDAVPNQNFLKLQALIFNKLYIEAVNFSPEEPDLVDLDKLATEMAKRTLEEKDGE